MKETMFAKSTMKAPTTFALVIAMIIASCDLVSEKSGDDYLIGKYEYMNDLNPLSEVMTFSKDSASLKGTHRDYGCVVHEGTRAYKLKRDSICFSGGFINHKTSCLDTFMTVRPLDFCRKVKIVKNKSIEQFIHDPTTNSDHSAVYNKIE